MAESEVSKVTVKIYGQDYTFASTKSRDRIISIAHHVDEVIRSLVAQGADGSVARITMLAAINIAEELLEERESQVEGDREKDQLNKDISHYQQLWEEAFTGTAPKSRRRDCRRKTYKATYRMTKSLFDQLQQAFSRDGYDTMQAGIDHAIELYLRARK